MRGAMIHVIASYRAELRAEEVVVAAETVFIEWPDADTHNNFLEAQRNHTLIFSVYSVTVHLTEANYWRGYKWEGPGLSGQNRDFADCGSFYSISQ